MSSLAHTGRRDPTRVSNHAPTGMFFDPEEELGEI